MMAPATAPAHSQPTLGLWPEPLPALPRVLEGFSRGDAVWLDEGGRRTAATVIGVLRCRHELTLRTSDHRILLVNPITGPARVTRRTVA